MAAAEPQGPYHADGHYVTITSKNYNTYSSFDWRKKQSTKGLIDQTFLAKGRYDHSNGSHYYSLYTTGGKWYGYVNARATTVASGVQGIWHATNQYVSLMKKGYPLWQSFFGTQGSNSSLHYQQTYHVAGYYKAANGETYLSLYTSHGQWQGYINQTATSKAPSAEGNWLKADQYVTISSSSYPLLKGFGGLQSDTKGLIQRTFHVTGEYKPADGQIYYSLYDARNHWIGYLDNRAVKNASGPQGAWLAKNATAIVVKSGYPFWPRFFSGNVKNTSTSIGQAVTINGMYQHMNGSTYYSVYQAGRWLGYVNAAAFSTAAVHPVSGFAMSAHRGDHLVAPENSLQAIAAAKQAGYGLVEMDIRATKDHQYVLMHDDTINRTTTGSGEVSALTLAQIEAASLDVSSYPALAGQTLRVPTFDQAIDAVAKNGLFANLDGSKGDWTDWIFTDHVVTKLKADNIYSSSFFVLSNAAVRKAFMTRYPDARITWLYSPRQGVAQTLAELGTYQHSLLTIADSQVTLPIIEKAIKAGIPVQVYGVNNAQRASELKAEGVTYIETDSVSPSQLSVR